MSTDSVYEVSNMKMHDGYLREGDAVRPHDENIREALNKRDSYGHKKLECEEVVSRYSSALNYEYVFLRLPDVLGPRDNTLRAYKYFMYTKLHNIIGPLHIPKHTQNVQLSFVYSIDVGRMIASLAHPTFHHVSVFNQSYNLAFKETITLKELLTMMGDRLNHGETKFDESDEAHENHGFPSVTRGPVDISKAISDLRWNPTDIKTAVEEICSFYEKMQYTSEFNYILDRVLDKLNVRGDKYRDFIELHHSKLNKEEL